MSRKSRRGEEAPHKCQGREDGRGDLDLGWDGLVPKTFHLDDAVVESRPLNGVEDAERWALISSLLKCTPVLRAAVA